MKRQLHSVVGKFECDVYDAAELLLWQREAVRKAFE